MIDAFSLILSHGLIFLLFWRLLSRPDLDRDPPASSPMESSQQEATSPDA